MRKVKKVFRSVAFYPVSAVYGASVLLAAAVAEGMLDKEIGLLILTAVAALALFVATFREVRTVHHLVNSQRDELLAQIAMLVEALEAHGVPIPDADKVEGSLEEAKQKGVTP